MRTKRLAIAYTLLVATPAWSDAPLAPPPAQVCSLNGVACASRDPNGRSAIVWRRGSGGTRIGVWRARITSPQLQVSDDGRSLVELYPGLNLLDPGAGPDTVVLVFHRPGLPPIAWRLRDVVVRPADLPKTVSHRQWASAYGFDGKGITCWRPRKGATCASIRLVGGHIRLLSGPPCPRPSLPTKISA